jgi:hypothetical protein
MKKSLSLYFLILFFLFGCTLKQEFDPVLSEIENLRINDPDSVYLVLEGLYPGKDFDTRNRAYYYILLTEARNEKGISLLECDSLIDFAVKNTNKSKYPALLAKAYLLKGRIQNELEEPQEAIQTFRKGIMIAEEIESASAVLSKLYDDLGNTYLNEFIYDKAKEIFQNEYALDLKMGNNRDIALSLRNFAWLYLFTEKMDSSYIYLDEALKYAKRSEDPGSLYDILYNDLSIWYAESGEYEKALEIANAVETQTDKHKLNKSELFIHLNYLDSARMLLSEIPDSEDIYTQLMINKYLSIIATKENDFKSALEYNKNFLALLDRVNNESKDKEIRIIDHKHNAQIVINRMEEKQSRINLIIVFAFILMIVSFIFLLSHFKRKRKEEADKVEKEIVELKNQILATDNEILQLQSTNEEHCLLLEAKTKEKEQLLDSLYEIEVNIFRKKKIYQKLEQIKSGKLSSLTSSKKNKLMEDLRESFVETLKQLRTKHPEFKEDRFLVACLRKSGYNSREIGIFLNYDDSTIRKKYGNII